MRDDRGYVRNLSSCEKYVSYEGSYFQFESIQRSKTALVESPTATDPMILCAPEKFRLLLKGLQGIAALELVLVLKLTYVILFT